MISDLYPIVLIDDMISVLYSKLLNLINYSKQEASLCFSRNAAQLMEFWLPKITPEQASTRITTLITSASIGRSAHNYIVRFALKQAGKYISYTRLVQLTIKQGFSSISDLEFLQEISKSEESNCAKQVIQTFCRVISGYKIFMRAAGELFIEELKIHGDEKDVRNWVQQYITMLFIFIKRAIQMNRFKRRVLGLCELLTSNSFNSIQWLSKSIHSNANAAFMLDNKPDLFKSFFYIGKEYPVTSYFQREYKKFEKYVKKSSRLKTFPFKPNSSQLVKIVKESPIEQKMNEREVDESLKGLGLSPRVMRYVYLNFEAGTLDQQQSIFLLEDFIDHEKQRFEKTEYLHDRFVRIDLSKFLPEGRLAMAGIKVISQELEDEIWEYQTNALREFISIAKEIIEALQRHPHLLANIKSLNRDLNHGCSDDQKYKKLKSQRKRLKKYAEKIANEYRVPNYLLDMHSCLLSVFYKFDANLQYAPPSEIDEQIRNYLNFSEFEYMIEPTADIVVSGIVAAALQTIWELTSAVVETVQLRGEATSVIIYTSIIRYMFDIIYIKNPVLNTYKFANLVFLKACRDYCEKPISYLELPEVILSRFPNRSSISILFKTKNSSLGLLDYLNNPIDLLFNIHSSLQVIISMVPGYQLPVNDQVKLFSGLIATYPANNTIAVIKFLIIWYTAAPSILMQRSFDIFKRAVDLILPLDEIALDNF